MLVLLAVLSQSWLFVHNWRTWGSWAGPNEFADTFRHEDGARGAAQFCWSDAEKKYVEVGRYPGP